MSATIPAISLHAWSTGRQGSEDRDSRTRQKAACDAFVERHRLQLIKTETIAGQSAYKGSGSFRGKGIDDLIKQRRQGTIPNGTVLVVEELSRLTRKNPVDVLGGLISDLWDSGIALGITQLDLLIDGDRARREPHHLHAIIVAAQLNYQDSKIKSIRSKSAWKNAKAAAEDGKVKRTGVCPYWLKWDEDSNCWIETPYAGIIKRIFDLSASGLGVSKISAILNEEGVQSYGGKDKMFSFRLVHKILQDITVTGAWTTREGEIIAENHYLPIISKEKFEEVQAGLKERLVDRSNRQCKVANIMQGLTVCHHCGSKFSYIGRNTNGKNREYLHCNGKREGKCKVNTFKYDERWLLSAVMQGRWEKWYKASSQSEELAEAREIVDRLQLEQNGDQKRLNGMEQRYQEAFSEGNLTDTDRRLQSAAIEQLSKVINEREPRLKAATQELERILASNIALDHKTFVSNVMDALNNSKKWSPDERLVFNRWLAKQGVTITIEHGAVARGDLPKELYDLPADLPSKLDWWLSVHWRDEITDLIPGSIELESWIQQHES